jgi:V/A-type H+/Na+-transporting ATPase subunit D
MPEPQRELAITRVALLELKDERRLVTEGYDLLDEKRILLAAEIRRQVSRLRGLRAEARKAEEAGRAALEAALRRHGCDELLVYPPLSFVDDRLEVVRSRLFGLQLLDVRLQPSPPKEGERAVNPSPEARACALAYRAWLAPLPALAACCLNLRRLVREYIRTERRARAIENVLLPEIDSGLKLIEEQLEGQDQEEAARMRRLRVGEDS